MQFQVTTQSLQHRFPANRINYEWVANHLTLDLGHLQLLRDCFTVWGHPDDAFLATLLYLVHEVNHGSLGININDQMFLRALKNMGVNSHVDTKDCQQWSQLKLAEQTIIVCDKYDLYFAKYWQVKRNLSTTLEQLLLNYSGLEFSPAQVSKKIQEVIDDLTFETVENKQVQAIVMSLLQPFSIISGGPGTGKTTIMCSVLRGLLKLGYQAQDMIMAAPTGRAANRMTESVHEVLSNHIKSLSESDEQLLKTSAMTIHRLLGAHPYRGGFDYGLHNQLTCKVLIIDEVSMVDVVLMKQLLQAVPKNCRVILLGDQFQLPSVDSGAVLADLMPPLGGDAMISADMKTQMATALEGVHQKDEIMRQLHVTNKPQLLTDKVTVLDVSKRCQSDIATISELIRCGDSDAVFSSKLWQNVEGQQPNSNGVWFLAASFDSQTWLNYCQQWVQQHYFAEEADFKSDLHQLHGFNEQEIDQYQTLLDGVFKTITSNRILTLINQSSLGSHVINKQISEMMRSRLAVTGYQNMYHGSVIMLQKNDSALHVFNGDIGILLENKNGQLRVVLPFKNSYMSHSIHVVPTFKSAYAMTVHKSQGSEFEHVLMPLLTDGNHRLMTREIIYTGMTRAKKSVTFYGEKTAFKTAIRKQTKRHSGLRFWYNETSSQQES